MYQVYGPGKMTAAVREYHRNMSRRAPYLEERQRHLFLDEIKGLDDNVNVMPGYYL